MSWPLPPAPYRPGQGTPRPRLASVETPQERISYGLALYAAGYWWESHEAWEGLWSALPRGAPERLLVQGLILLAAAQLKAWCGRSAGCQILGARAVARLEAAQATLPAGAMPYGLALAPLLDALRRWLALPPPAAEHAAVLAAAPRLYLR